MRNLKRALSLGLTATMISGLMVMGSSAASYADVTSEQNQEAIEVLKEVGIMVGDDKGNFNPEANVTRNEMAVVMSNLMAYNVKTYANTSPFTDVPEWAEPYVAACYTNGITSGYDAKTYGGSDSVTTGQAALMVMKALGYFQYQSDFGADWQLSTVAQGNKIDLFDDVDSGVKEAMTRNDVAQLVLNALEAGTVEAEKNGQDINVGDISITSGVTYKYVTSGKDYAKAINDNQSTSANSINGVTAPIVELGEKLYQGDLTKASEEDDFGRPATKWEYQAKEIGTFADKTWSAVALDNKGAVAKVVYIEDGDISGTDQTIFAIANSGAKIQKDKDNGEYYEITAVVNGEIKTLNVKAGSNSAVDALVKGIDNNAADISSKKSVVALKSYTENADGFVTSAKEYTAMDADGDGLLNNGSNLFVTGTKKAEDGTVGLGGTYYAYSDDVVVARWNLDDQDVEMSRINSVKNDTNDVAIAIMDGRTVIGLFIIENKGGEADVKEYDVTFTGKDSKAWIRDLSGNDLLAKGNTVKVSEGSSLQFKVDCVGGYVVDTVKVGNTVLTPDANGVYTVSNVKANASVDLTFKSGTEVTFTVTSARVTIDGKSVKNGEKMSFAQGDVITLEATPANGKTLTVTYGSAQDGYGENPTVYEITITTEKSLSVVAK